jgi:enoyl-CoA hydratase/carnithine racemase
MSSASAGGAGSAPDRSVLVNQTGEASLITLNRPEKRNALSSEMLRELVDALTDAGRRTDGAVIVLTGAGSAFCSGDDLSEAARADAEAFDESIALLQEATRILVESKSASVAALNGPAIGGGLELALACDVRIAAETAVFACPEVAWGLVCTNGASVLLPEYIGLGRARDMLLTGRPYDAEWALAAGLVTEVVSPNQVLDRAMALAVELAERAGAVQLTRELLRDGRGDGVLRALERESAAVAAARRSPAAAMSLLPFAGGHDRMERRTR